MPITRSMENLNAEQPANCSFTIPVESNSQATSRRGNPQSIGNAGTEGDSSTPSNNLDRQQIRRMINSSMSTLRGEMTDFIRNELRSLVRDMTLGENVNSHNSQPPNNPVSSNSSPRTGNGQEPFVGEKVSNIIRNWRVKFSGCDDQMTVDEFIYRINVLTTNNLNGDFELLTRHSHGLFEGKALDWYWRYHRQDNVLDWFALTRALREQYKGDYTDFDVMEDIHRRKQRTTETFDDFYDSISAMTDRLKNPISDANLCAILVRNLRNEIRHELIHMDITNVAHLRREVKRHEKFITDIRGQESKRPTRGHISEIDFTNTETTILETPVSDICALRTETKCWNCDKTGHNYYDCLDVRRVFCYGCGAKDTYRPTCPKCGVKPQGNGQKDVRRN